MILETFGKAAPDTNNEDQFILASICAGDCGNCERVGLETSKCGKFEVNMLTRTPSERDVSFDREKECIVGNEINLTR